MTEDHIPDPRKKVPAVGAPVQRRVRRLVAQWIDGEGCTEQVRQSGSVVRVIRCARYVRPGSVACKLTDTGNGFLVVFPGHGSCDLDHCFSLDYADARSLVLALTPHAKDLGFDA